MTRTSSKVVVDDPIALSSVPNRRSISAVNVDISVTLVPLVSSVGSSRFAPYPGTFLTSVMFLSVTIVLSALGFVSSATLSPINRHSGVRIPLPTRNSFVKADGTFDHDKAVMHGIKVAL